jgi:hypothetical protein
MRSARGRESGTGQQTALRPLALGPPATGASRVRGNRCRSGRWRLALRPLALALVRQVVGGIAVVLVTAQEAAKKQVEVDHIEQ